jgi:membrane protease YdiL (CAAX protease family)
MFKKWFGMIFRSIPHSAVLQQISAPQPRLVVVLLCLGVPWWLPTLLVHMLKRWPAFWTLASEHDTVYLVGFFLVQLSLVCGSVVFLSKKYRSAVWTPQPSWPRGTAVSLLLLLPLFLFYLSRDVRGIRAMIGLSTYGVEGAKALASAHLVVWGRLAYGLSLAGVLCGSIAVFVAPVLEELVFSGFVINAIAKRHGFVAAVLGASTCFTLVHVPRFGVGQHLLLVFFAGVTCALIRVFSGSLLLAVFGHWTINTVIFLPKWVLAVIHFG